MKKLLLSSCFLASGVVFAGATTVTTTMLTLPASNDALVKATLDSSSGWAQNIGTSSITTDIVATDYAILLNNSYTSGQWLWNVANVNFNDYTAGSEVAVVTEDDTVTGFSYHGRRAYGGEFVLTSVALSSFVGEGAAG